MITPQLLPRDHTLNVLESLLCLLHRDAAVTLKWQLDVNKPEMLLETETRRNPEEREPQNWESQGRCPLSLRHGPMPREQALQRHVQAREAWASGGAQ